ncbi:MAG: hypothetical protein QOG80_2928 [Pseudonocardiales bacterium]|nr:hypothetical protein [Pseudonocardiales bacterium]
MTCVASPVGYANGSALLVGAAVVRGGAGAVVVRGGAGFEVRGRDVLGAGDVEAGELGAAAADDVRAASPVGLPAVVDAHAVSTRTAPIAADRERTRTRPGCHVTPMRIRGWVVGASHCISATRLLSGMATHPAVGWPSVTCRNTALPAPGRTPVAELRVL